MPFTKPRVLSDSELNTIRGKCLVARASPEELMQMIGHFDLVEMELREALEMAINSVECACIDVATGKPLPWYRAARRALDDPLPEGDR